VPRRHTTFRAGHYYHIYNRGVDRGDIFLSTENYAYFLRLLKKNSARYAVGVVAYCLLPNHYHLLLKPTVDNNLQLLAKSTFGSYSQAVSKQQSRSGPLFQGRYRSIHVAEEDYLADLARYIHLNPTAAGIVAAPASWAYSNYRDVIGQRRGTLRDGTLVPGLFSSGDAYRLFVERKTIPEAVSFRDGDRPHVDPARLRRYALE
jgi:REP element-mobilizing transposase RayT